MPTVISYIPAVHQGYINFFKQYPHSLLILGTNFVHEVPRMERDIRAVNPQHAASMLKGLGILEEIKVLEDAGQLEQLPSSEPIIMPDEDVTRAFASRYLERHDIEFVPVFLRWDRQISTTEFEVPPNRTISTEELDREMISLADRQAAKSADWWRQIGAIISKDGKPLLLGHNKPLLAEDYTVNIFGDPRSNFDYGEYIELVKTIHAEAGVIAEAAKRGLMLEGSSMYVSTFPCPNCAKLIAAAGIKRVYYKKGYSMLDAEDILAAHKVEIILVD
jgi:dCMP deaminase